MESPLRAPPCAPFTFAVSDSKPHDRRELNNQRLSTLIHSCQFKIRQLALAQYWIGRVAQYSIGADRIVAMRLRNGCFGVLCDRHVRDSKAKESLCPVIFLHALHALHAPGQDQRILTVIPIVEWYGHVRQRQVERHNGRQQAPGFPLLIRRKIGPGQRRGWVDKGWECT